MKGPRNKHQNKEEAGRSKRRAVTASSSERRQIPLLPTDDLHGNPRVAAI